MQAEILLIVYHQNLDRAAKLLGDDLPLLLSLIIVHTCIVEIVQPPP